MKNIIYIVFINLLTFSCSNNENRELKEKINELQTQNKRLTSIIAKEQQPSSQEVDKVAKNYIKRTIENVDIFIPELIVVENATMEYTKDYEDLYAYLHVDIKNNLNRKINSILLQLESIDCDNEESKYLSENVSILPDSTKKVKINIHGQLIENYRRNCHQHTPIVKVSEAILETKERYLNIENVK